MKKSFKFCSKNAFLGQGLKRARSIDRCVKFEQNRSLKPSGRVIKRARSMGQSDLHFFMKEIEKLKVENYQLEQKLEDLANSSFQNSKTENLDHALEKMTIQVNDQTTDNVFT